MSYILDALKKLEHEKTRKSRGAGMVNISGALFEQEKSGVAAPKTGWKIALAVTVAVVLTFGVTWFVLKPAARHEKPAPQVTQAAAPAPVAAPVRPEITPVPSAAPVVAVPVNNPAPPPARAATAVPLTAVKPVPARPMERAARADAPAPAAATATAEDAAAQLTMQPLRARGKERPGQKPAADQIMAAPADITLSGIAWQDERRARRAVVNGFLMQEGGTVSGARITDIYQDRVRFTISGKYFEIPLTSAGFPATGK